jgi:hypothetical protein
MSELKSIFRGDRNGYFRAGDGGGRGRGLGRRGDYAKPPFPPRPVSASSIGLAPG